MPQESPPIAEKVEIQLPEKYNLYYTFMSSFACYLFELENEDLANSQWLGLVSPFEGAIIRQEEDKLQFEFSSEISLESKEYLLKDVTGLWYEPKATTSDDRASQIVSMLSERVFPGVRIPRLAFHKWEVLCSILFSIHAKVPLSRSWFASLYRRTGKDWKELARMPPSEAMRLTADGSGQSAGFRARYLIGAINDLYRRYPGSPDPLQTATTASRLSLRMNLMQIQYVGPKVADCFLLNAMGDTSTPPVDVNVYRVTQNLGILPPYLGLPSSELCTMFACTPDQSTVEGVPLCPKAERTIALLEGKTESVSGTCVRAALTMKFSDAGWVQALLFLYGQRYCTRYFPNCKTCELKDFSVLEKISGVVPIRTRSAPRIGPVILEPYIPENMAVFEFYPNRKGDCLDYMKKLCELTKSTQSVYSRGSKSSLAAFLWLATKEHVVPAFADEIAEAYEVEPRDLLNTSSSVRFALELNPPNLQAHSYIERLQKVLLFSDDILRRAVDLASNFPEQSGRRPESVASAALFITMRNLGVPVNLKSISDSLGITDVTVRNSVRSYDQRARLG